MKTRQDFYTEQNVKLGEPAKEGFDKMINSKKFYHYCKNYKSDNGLATYNVYGDYGNNLLYMTLENQNGVHYGCVDSPVLYPAMIDRHFAIDQQDNTWVTSLGDILCYIFHEGHTLEEFFAAK